MPKQKFYKFVQKAIKHPGALSKKAARAGMSIAQYCQKSNLDTQTIRQCNFWKNFLTGRKRKKAKSSAAKRAMARRR